MSTLDTSHSVLRFARRFFAGTVLSRISGAMRDIAMAFCFGSAPEIGAFMVAYRFANLFRRLLGEGSLQASFTPQLASFQGKEASLFYRDAAFSLLVILLSVTVLLEISLFSISSLLSSDWAEILSLSMRMVPGLIFICLYAINSAFLQTQKKYFVSGFAPVMFNLSWILVAFLSYSFPLTDAMRFLSIGVSCAFALQWLVTSIQVGRSLSLSWSEWLRPRLFSSDWKKMIKPMTFGIIGVGAMQINSALDAIFSRFSDLSGPAYLWYAIRVEQLPLALFGIALSGALLPPLSRAIGEGAIDRYRHLLQTALRHSAALLIPCTLGIFVLGGAVLQLLYGHGHFLPADVEQTLYCLWGYGIGLLPSVFILLLAAGFYAQKSYLIPTLASLCSVAFHILLNAVLVFGFHLGAFSIAISTSLASILNCMILAFFVRTKLEISVFSSLWGFFFRLFLCASFAGALILSMPEFPKPLELLCKGILFLASFYLLAHRMKMNEVFDIFKR